VAAPGRRLLDMAAAFVCRERSTKSFFYSPAAAAKCFFIFGKIYPFLKEFREQTNNPEAFANIQKVATSSKTARKRLERVSKNIENRRKALAKSAKKA